MAWQATERIKLIVTCLNVAAWTLFLFLPHAYVTARGIAAVALILCSLANLFLIYRDRQIKKMSPSNDSTGASDVR